MTLYEVTAWYFEGSKFTGYLYTQKEVIDHMGDEEWYEVNKVTLMRTHKPMDHMTYKVVE